jgi:hypothetical protein
MDRSRADRHCVRCRRRIALIVPILLRIGGILRDTAICSTPTGRVGPGSGYDATLPTKAPRHRLLSKRVSSDVRRSRSFLIGVARRAPSGG